MTEKRFITIESGIDFGVIDNTTDERIFDIDITAKLNELADENEQLKQLAEGNEESLLTVMTYLHDNHYDIWEKVNKECFND